jgi:hypothetical protein
MNATAAKKPRFGSQPVAPLSGHKCMGAKMCFEVSCECGWVSCPHSGDGARGYAYSEWRDHVRSAHASKTQRGS